MVGDRKKAVKYLEEIQKKYCQPSFSLEREKMRELLTSKSFLVSQLENLRNNYPNHSDDELIEACKSYFTTDELVGDSIYQNPIWEFLMVRHLKEIKAVIKNRYGWNLSNCIFGTLPFGPINGYAIKVPDSTYKLIVLPEGVYGFFNLLTKALSDIFIVQGETTIDKKIILDNLHSNGQVRDRVFDLVISYSVFANPFKVKQYVNRNETKTPMQGWIRSSVELFIICHEIGHVGMGHHDNRSIDYLSEHKSVMSHLQEFEADNVGLNICMDIFVERKVGTAIGFVGSDFFFATMIFMQKCLDLLRNGKVSEVDSISDTHPSFKDRRVFIRSLLSKLDSKEREEILDFADTLDMVLSVLFEKLQLSLFSAHAKGVRPNSLWN